MQNTHDLNTNHVCAVCDNTGSFEDTEGLVWDCVYRCGKAPAESAGTGIDNN